MHQLTREKLNAYEQAMAEANNVTIETVSRGKSFNVTPTMQQKLENAITQNSDFLKLINNVNVDEMTGETLRLGVSKPIASRADTAGSGKREPSNIGDLASRKYELKQTNFDTSVTYNQLDAWAKFPDFAKRIADQKTKRIALDRICIGFNGTEAAKSTAYSSHNLLQDVNIGWLKHIETDATTQTHSDWKIGTGEEEKTYKTLDALVFSALNTVIKEEYRDDTEMVAIVGRELLLDKYLPIQNQVNPTEKLAGDIILAQKRVGGLQAITVPYFPKDAVLITRLDNLSIYTQAGKTRRLWQDQPESDRYVDFLSMNEAYVVENYDAVAYIKGINAEAV